MIDTLRKVLLLIARRGAEKTTSDDMRRLAIQAVKAGARLPELADRIGAAHARQLAETSRWVEPAALAAGQGGRFDACDVRHWLTLSARAGVPLVPAVEILRLTEEEMSTASGAVRFPDGALRRRLASHVERYLPREAGEPQDDGHGPGDAAAFEAVEEKLYAAMDNVPEGWMVRHARCGPSTLKSLAGCGVAGPRAPEVRFGPGLEVGPGWIRTGNRRRVDAADDRIVRHGCAEGPDGDQIFVARPWIHAARWAAGEDPHRHGSQFAGKGAWPAEWRAFIERGRVVGVASYYAWAWEPTPENAAAALEVRGLAQRIVDEASRQDALPVFMPLEFVRDHPQAAPLRARFPEGSINATLDFIEGPQGPTLLEGGPAFYGPGPVGGGHPCAFAGVSHPDGVAFRIMPGVNIAEPKTWRDTEREGCILTWAEAESLAQAAADAPG